MTATSDLSVRALSPGDFAEWRALWTAYLEFYESSVPTEVYETTFARLLDEDPRNHQCFVAVSGGTMVGLTHYLFHRHAWRIEEVCYLQDLYAAPHMRGQGVGRALIEAVYAAADARSAGQVYWLTQTFNETARKLYDRIGVETPFIKYQRP